ncbi:CPBP family glutamic-type intramembrane protease [Acidaminobacter sp. JC074]|uniref:CPBP family glutamic-type intramembrane protease n=1 Tax=Acidaminobacter sp. JC074 TaxID=2530199 RepID=UPI001F10D5B2|nr:CPBP family glutamic-type intramembrane protease [Acidaminobacter sp. JC074]
MERNQLKHTDREGMIATSFLLIYLLFAYLLVYWTKTVSGISLTRENFIVNIFMYVVPCFGVISMVYFQESTLTSLGMSKRKSLWILGLMILSLVFYTQDLLLKIIIIVISEEIIFRGYAANRLRASFGKWGSIVIAGIILGLLYSVVPFVTKSITLSELGVYILIGLATQLILQKMYFRFNNIIMPMVFHTGILFIAL